MFSDLASGQEPSKKLHLSGFPLPKQSPASPIFSAVLMRRNEIFPGARTRPGKNCSKYSSRSTIFNMTVRYRQKPSSIRRERNGTEAGPSSGATGSKVKISPRKVHTSMQPFPFQTPMKKQCRRLILPPTDCGGRQTGSIPLPL